MLNIVEIHGSGADEVVTIAVTVSVSAALPPPLLMLLSSVWRNAPALGSLLTDTGADCMHRCQMVNWCVRLVTCWTFSSDIEYLDRYDYEYGCEERRSFISCPRFHPCYLVSRFSLPSFPSPHIPECRHASTRSLAARAGKNLGFLEKVFRFLGFWGLLIGF